MLRRDNSQPPADLWRQAINRGHSGRARQRSSDYATAWPDLNIMQRISIALSAQISREKYRLKRASKVTKTDRQTTKLGR